MSHRTMQNGDKNTKSASSLSKKRAAEGTGSTVIGDSYRPSAGERDDNGIEPVFIKEIPKVNETPYRRGERQSATEKNNGFLKEKTDSISEIHIEELSNPVEKFLGKAIVIKEKMRSSLAWGFLTLLGIVLIQCTVACWGSWPNTKEMLSIVLPTLAALAGAASAYYYKHK